MIRRQFLKSSSAMALSLAATQVSRRVVAAESSATEKSSPPIEKVVSRNSVVLGNDVLTVLTDGTLELPANFAIPHDASDQEREAVLERMNVNEGIYRPDCNVTLFQYGDRLVLFDVGSGPNFMSSAGLLLSTMEDLGIAQDDITDVVFTHAHPDHIWGVLDDFDDLAFSAANYHISEKEWDYWRDPATLDALPESRKAFAIGARNRFDAIESAVNVFKFGDEVLPGIEAYDTVGHTPGHTAFVVHSGSETAIVAGDALTNQVASFENPSQYSGSDQDQPTGAKTRVRLLDRIAQEKTCIVGYHLNYPGIGYAEKQGSAYRFVTG